MKGKIEALAAAAAGAAAAGAAAVWAKRKRKQAGLQANVTSTAGVRTPARVSAPAPTAAAARVPNPARSGARAEEAGRKAEADVAPAGDDLTSIKGIGPVNARKLAAIHITTFAQIAAWADEDISRVGNEIDESPGRIKREDWVGQAQAMLGS